ncbi:MAG: GGDEF domain-containing protein [Steroidobacteraceae bacterium]|nr:GGDEF domain-containing protein [Steroidobacteraceae bacterium]
MRKRWLALVAGLVACATATVTRAEAAFVVDALPAEVGNPPVAEVAGGALDSRFGEYRYGEARRRGEPFWLRLRLAEAVPSGGAPALLVQKGRHLSLEIFARGAEAPLRLAAGWPGFRGVQSEVYTLPLDLEPAGTLYVRVSAAGRGSEELLFSLAVAEAAVTAGFRQAQVIALAFGALMAMSAAALLIWFLLRIRLLLHYAGLFSLQALYVAYLSGQGFEWPILGLALPLQQHAWNVPAALSGAVACLFVREIADLRHFSPRVYAIFGWLAGAFVVLAAANALDLVGLGGLVASVGNLVFVGTAVFTLVVAFLAWRRGSRAAGWFLLAWALLEAFTIAAAVSFLLSDAESMVVYLGLPLSMVAAAVLVALGVADRLREQRRALSEAERHAQTDPLTGVLNRRSLVERLDAACERARARGMPVALLFIDLDHFKEVNDTYGHLAGDACLRAVIAPMHSELRHSDAIGRYGGEEFVVILDGADAAAAEAIARRMLQRVAELAVEGFGPPIRLTCSIGVAASDALGVWGEQLIARADAAVYAAKSSGRNRVHLALPVAA